MRMIPGLLFLLLIAAVGYTLVTGINDILQEKTLNVDSALFAEMARVDLNGGTLYLDRWDNKPPVIFWYLEPFIALLGRSVLTIDLAVVAHNLLLSLAVGSLVYVLTHSGMATVGSLLIAIPYAIGIQKVETTVLMSALGVGAMTLAVGARGRPIVLFLAGVLFAAGVLTKQPLILELPVLLMFAAYAAPRRRQAVLSVIAGGLAATLIFGVWLIVKGNAEPFFRHIVLDSYAYIAHNADSLHSAVDQNRFDETWPRFLPLAPLVILSTVTLIRQRIRLVVLALLWVVLSVIAAAIGTDLKFAYFIQTIPALSVLVALAIPFYRRWNTAARIVLLMGSLAAVIYFAGQFIRRPNNGLAEYMQAASSYVQEQSAESDCLWLWSQFNDLSFLAGRRSCSALPMDIHAVKADRFDTRRNQNEMLSDLFLHPARLHVLFSDYPYFPQLARFADRYRRRLLFDGMYRIYEVDMSGWHPLTATFGDTASLVGYDWPPRDRVCPGDSLPLALTWQRGSAPAEGVERVVRLLAPDGQTVAATGSAPLSDEWPADVTPQAGDVLLGSSFALTLPETSPAGRYSLRLALRQSGGEGLSAEPEIELQAVTVDAC